MKPQLPPRWRDNEHNPGPGGSSNSLIQTRQWWARQGSRVLRVYEMSTAKRETLYGWRVSLELAGLLFQAQGTEAEQHLAQDAAETASEIMARMTNGAQP